MKKAMGVITGVLVAFPAMVCAQNSAADLAQKLDQPDMPKVEKPQIPKSEKSAEQLNSNVNTRLQAIKTASSANTGAIRTSANNSGSTVTTIRQRTERVSRPERGIPMVGPAKNTADLKAISAAPKAERIPAVKVERIAVIKPAKPERIGPALDLGRVKNNSGAATLK